MTNLRQLVGFLDGVLEGGPYHDRSLNGLQVEAPAVEVSRVAYAVDAGESVIRAAIDRGADLLLVHHGLFWGVPAPITGALGRKISALLMGGCSLYASHLPLDAHPEYGNNVLLARMLGAGELTPFATHKGVKIGFRGVFPQPVSLEMIAERARALPGFSSELLLPFGRKEIRTVGVVTGAGGFALGECVAEGIDLFVSGEPQQHLYHEAKESGVNALFAGHYATETLGVRAVAELLRERFEVEVHFIDEPTGI